jgi:hypothetical protein
MKNSYVPAVIDAAVCLFGSYNQRKFRAHFGVSVEAVSYIWTMVMLYSWSMPIDVSHVLWTLYYLKCYPTNDIASGFLRCDVKTYNKYVEYVLFYVLPTVLPEVS